ncbi:isochorismatase [Actinokineospora fastidiosa]|uniref:Isochorismatase n=1 Tax=Actinokineospora fastidiosa TaxID=1816 RepID=A0A918GIQ6_9PSEU|nr:isochorismatase [Actinokineospora fastidiosa]
MLVDVQRNMIRPPTPVPSAPAVEAAVVDLLTRARIAGVPVVHVRNNGGTGDPDETGTPGWELVHDVVGGEHVVDKTEPDAFAGTLLADLIPSGSRVVIAGMQSEYCVRETALSALRRGHEVVLAAHATYDDDTDATTIARRVERELAAAGVSVGGEIAF